MKIAQLLATVAFTLALPLPLRGQERARLDTTVRLNLRGTVDLSLRSGKITVRGWDLPDVKILASTENGALRFNATSNRVTLRVEQEGKADRSRGEATYDVSVPRGTRLLLQTASGNITANGSQGEISASTVSGAVDVSGGRRQVALESVSGPIKASQVAGDLRAQNVSGSVRAENVSGRVEAWTVTGAIRLIGLRANDIHAETVRGDIVYAGRVATGGTYDLQSHSGTIRLTIPRSTSAQFRLEAVRGAVQTDFPIQTPSAGGAREGGRVEFTIGDGQAEVTARTFSGRILIKSDGGPSILSNSSSIPRSDSPSILRSDSVSRTRKDSTSAPRKNSVPTTGRDSLSTIR
jgi:DUF4097 and DUF4098 domain-containing protein YvlB